ncbi:uncharacterized protein LOC142645475 [Dermatophagoides pteronyssinus]|uniref:uncharacterized protein LOC142645475 n=1 Tax=Dermatophagoides pteronyssinus TaxID=6956 RepID=UPI003F6722E0
MANQNINDQNDNENYLDKTINTLINFFEDSLQSDKEFLDILQKLQTENLNNNQQTINNNIDSNKIQQTIDFLQNLMNNNNTTDQSKLSSSPSSSSSSTATTTTITEIEPKLEQKLFKNQLHPNVKSEKLSSINYNNVKNYKYRCDYNGCSYATNNATNLKTHQLIHNPKIETYPCPKCSAIFITEKGFENHYSHKHNQSRE